MFTLDLESWALKSGIQLKENRIALTIGVRNPRSSDKQSRISTRNPEFTARNSDFKTVLEILLWGESISRTSEKK